MGAPYFGNDCDGTLPRVPTLSLWWQDFLTKWVKTSCGNLWPTSTMPPVLEIRPYGGIVHHHCPSSLSCSASTPLSPFFPAPHRSEFFPWWWAAHRIHMNLDVWASVPLEVWRVSSFHVPGTQKKNLWFLPRRWIEDGKVWLTFQALSKAQEFHPQQWVMNILFGTWHAVQPWWESLVGDLSIQPSSCTLRVGGPNISPRIFRDVSSNWWSCVKRHIWRSSD